MSTKISTYDLISKAKMSDRPEFYSGRGARYCDLNPDQLKTIYDGVKENIGDDAASAFVEMIENMDSLSATNFLNNLYALEARDWKYVPIEESDIDVGPDGPQREVIGLASIFSALSSNDVDDTEAIRRGFFYKIGYTPKPKEEDNAIGIDGYPLYSFLDIFCIDDTD